MKLVDNMEIEEVIIKLRETHMEFGNLIDRLEEVDIGENIEEYNDILRDYHWDNRMLSNRFKRCMLNRGYEK